MTENFGIFISRQEYWYFSMNEKMTFIYKIENMVFLKDKLLIVD